MTLKKRIGYLLLIDSALIFLAGFLAISLRFDLRPPAIYLEAFLLFLFLIVAINLPVLYFHKLYHQMWSYASIEQLLTIIKSASMGMTATILIMYFIPFENRFPRSVVLLTWVLIMLFIGGSRLAWRIYRDIYLRPSNNVALKRVLIVGAGDAGAMVARELLKPNGLYLKPVGFVDDDMEKESLHILGLSVLGGRYDIPNLVQAHYVDEIIIAIPSASKQVIREIVNICKETGVHLRILPGIYELIGGRVSINQIRDVQVEDLLGREPVKIDLEEIATYIDNKVVLVTGAGGSIGSELCRQSAKFNAKTLVLLGHGENSIYEIELELKKKFPELEIQTEIADIQDKFRIERVFAKYQPQVVFHAAAHKHVPLMERNPEEAVKNNVIGTKNVAEAADKFKTNVFVMVSTDKAVNPTSVMGATKRVAEMIVQHMDQISDTRFVAVRFGNVLGSRGSVIPIFKRQIQEGGPVTVTHPEMVRYFMTIPEAVQLVIQAGSMAKGGEIFILDMGEPVKIADLARDLIKLSGCEPNVDIKIEFTGVRPGEKLFEELLTTEEGNTRTKHERIFVAKPTEVPIEEINELIHMINLKDEKASKELVEQGLKKLISSFRVKSFYKVG